MNIQNKMNNDANPTTKDEQSDFIHWSVDSTEWMSDFSNNFSLDEIGMSDLSSESMDLRL